MTAKIEKFCAPGVYDPPGYSQGVKVTGANAPSLPVQIFSQIQFEADPSIAAASPLQIVIVGGLILLVQRLFRLRLMV